MEATAKPQETAHPETYMPTPGNSPHIIHGLNSRRQRQKLMGQPAA